MKQMQPSLVADGMLITKDSTTQIMNEA